MRRKLTVAERKLAYFCPGAFFIHLVEHPDGGPEAELRNMIWEAFSDFARESHQRKREMEAIGRACAKALDLLNPELPKLNEHWDPVACMENMDEDQGNDD